MRQTPESSLQLARLVRLARDHELADSTRELVKSLLLRGILGDAEDEAKDAALENAARLAAAETRALRESDARAAQAAGPKRAAAAARATAPRDPIPPRAKAEAELVELRIRQLVELEAGWDKIEPLAWELFSLVTTPRVGARILELVFLHGATQDVENVVVKLKHHVPEFYRDVHAAVRAHLCVRFWREGGGEALVSMLFRDKDEAFLQPVERLFVFLTLNAQKDNATAYIYFRRYRRELLDAVGSIGPHLELSLSRFHLSVGAMAIDAGYDQDARELLEQIRPEDPDHDEALTLLLNVAADRSRAGRSHYVESLLQHTDSRERLALLAKFLGATRGLGGFKDRNRPALNEILKNPLEWFAEEAEIYGALSELLVSNRDLETLLPNLLDVFKQQSTKFLSPVLDGALWQGPLGLPPPDSARDRFYQGCAFLHQYVSCGLAAEKSLWQARDLILEARRDARMPMPHDWRELHKAAVAWVAKNRYLMETDRARMLLQLKVALDPGSVITADVEEYIEQTETPPVHVLQKLERLAEAKAAPALECRLILKRAEITHLTNVDLDRLWTLAAARKEPDLSWRVATVLHARRSLMPSVRHAWEISGEKRSLYEFVPPSKQAVERCLKGFSPKAARLAFALVHIGPVLPELLALIDEGAKPMRVSGHPTDSVESSAEKLLSGLSWLATPKKRYRFSHESAVAPGLTVPGFMQVLPANPWAILVAKLSERFGINAWGWKLSTLNNLIVDLIPRLATRADLRHQSGRVAQWLKTLAPEQRAAWSDLSQLTRAMSDDEAQDALATFVCRLATLMYQNHYLALTSLQAMRARVAVIWDLERWIVSDGYSELRRKLETANRVLVPNSLQRLTVIAVPPRPETKP